MVGLQRHRRIEAGPPVVQALPRRAVDQVEAQLVEPRPPSPPDDIGESFRVVRPVENPQHVGHGRLHPERDPVDPALAQGRQRARIHAVRVGLGRDLRVRPQPELVTHRLHDPHQVGRRQQGRGSAAEEHRGHRHVAVPQHPTRLPDLRDRRVRVRRPRRTRRGAELARRVGVEVAVTTAHRAERHVHVDAERHPPDLAQRLVGKRAVSRSRLALRECRRHGP